MSCLWQRGAGSSLVCFPLLWRCELLSFPSLYKTRLRHMSQHARSVGTSSATYGLAGMAHGKCSVTLLSGCWHLGSLPLHHYD